MRSPSSLLLTIFFAISISVCTGRFSRCYLNRPRNCEEVQVAGHTASGIYPIYPDDFSEKLVYCDLETDGGGWTVFQRRAESEQRNDEFYRPWVDYVRGFGWLDKSFWLELDTIADLTQRGDKELLVEMTDWKDVKRFALYENFQVGNFSTNYLLTVGNYSGNAGDSLSVHTGMQFSTYDNDHDRSDGNCAEVFKGGWWYANCHWSNLNGLYLRGEHKSYANGVNWLTWHGHNYSLKRTEMKIRTRNYRCFRETLANFC